MKIEQDKEIKVEVIEIGDDEVIVKILEGSNKDVEFSIELFLPEDETSHDIEIGDIAFVKLRMAN